MFGGEKGLGEMSSRISFCFIDHIDVFSLLLFVPRTDVVFFYASSAFVVVHEIIRRDSGPSLVFSCWLFDVSKCLGKT